jgi:hypothetical protein
MKGMTELRLSATESRRRQRGLWAMEIGVSAFTWRCYHKNVA